RVLSPEGTQWRRAGLTRRVAVYASQMATSQTSILIAVQLGQGIGQPAQNAAFFDWQVLAAAFAQGQQLRLQGLQLIDAPADVANVFVQQDVDIPAVLAVLVPDAKEFADFIMRHVQGAAIPDERQAFGMFFLID